MGRLSATLSHLPLRKPLVIGFFFFIVLTVWAVMWTAATGYVWQDNVISFLKGILQAVIFPICGYYFSSTVEHLKKTVPDDAE